ILASGPKSPHQQAGHMDASDPIRPSKKLLWHGGRPHAFAGTTRVNFASASTAASAQLLRPPCGSSTNTTGVPFLTLRPNKPASQFVSRTQPWDSDLLTFEGLGVPWMPYPSAESPIQYDPTGLFGPGLIVNAVLDFTPLNL